MLRRPRFSRAVAVPLAPTLPKPPVPGKKSAHDSRSGLSRQGEGEQNGGIVNELRPGPKVVLLDLVLPKMNEMRLLDHMRHARGWKQVPFVVVSGQAGEPTVVRQLLASGVAGILSKPFDLERMRREFGKFIKFRDSGKGEISVEIRDDENNGSGSSDTDYY